MKPLASIITVYISNIIAWCDISFNDKTSNPLYYAKNLYLNNELIIELVIPETVLKIKDYSFYNCSGLTSITIGDSVTSIGYAAFSGCSGLTSITIGGSVTSIASCAFSNCSNLVSVVIPNSVNEIGFSTFSNCSNLTSIEFEDATSTWKRTTSTAHWNYSYEMDISNPQANATYFTKYYDDYRWRKF